MGLFSGGGVLGDIGGALGINTDKQEKAAERAAGAQLQSGREAIEEQRAAREEAREILDPFVDLGTRNLGRINTAVLGRGVPVTPELERLTLEGLDFGVSGGDDLLDIAGQDIAFSEDPLVAQSRAGIQGILSGPQLTLDPNVLQSPFFQALRDEATRNLEGSAAARGRIGAGDTKEAIARSNLLLGSQFAQQDLQNRLAAQGQRFGQLQAGLGLGQGLGQQDFANRLAEAERQFGQTQAGLGFGLGARTQGVGQLSDLSQINFANRLAANQQRFNQLQNLVNLGQTSAAGVGAQGLGSAQNVGNILQGMGNAQAAGLIQASNARAQGNQNLMQLLGGAAGGAALGQAGLLGGAGAGLGALIGVSDKRLKRSIIKVKTLKNSLGDLINLYLFKYLWSDDWYTGVMAQEVGKIIPGSVIDIGGYKAVNYSRIFDKRFGGDEWQ